MSDSESDTEIVFDFYDPPPEFEKLLNIQDIIFGITNQNYASKCQDLESSEYFQTPHGIYVIVVNFLNAIKYRPTQHMGFANALKFLFNSRQCQYLEILKSYFISQFRAIIEDPSSYPRESSTIAFFYDAFTIECFTIEQIVAMMKQIYSGPKVVPTESSIVLFFYFSREISSFDSNFFNTLLSTVMNSEERSLPQEIHDALVLMNDLFANDFQMLQGWRSCHSIPDSCADALMKDDPTLLQTILVKEKLSFDVTLPSNIFGLSEFVTHSPTLIQFATFFGSIKCFKYLLLNKANMSLTDETHLKLVHYAVAGGNSEIIHILEQNSTLFSRTLPISIEFNHSDLFEWLYENYYDCKLFEDALPIPVSEIAKRSNNARSFEFLFRNKIQIKPILFKSFEQVWNSYLNGFIVTLQVIMPDLKINTKYTAYDNHYSPLHWAIKKRYDGIITEIINTKGVNLNTQDDYGKTPFYLAAELGYIDVLTALKEKGVEINRRAKSNLSPIHAAIRCNQTESVQFLLQSTTYDLNLKDAVFLLFYVFIWVFLIFLFYHFPLHVAVLRNYHETLKILLSIPNLNVNVKNNDGIFY